jgi:Ca2+-binding RTX toxin-like protein
MAQVIISSDFESGLDGWIALAVGTFSNTPLDWLVHAASGGNPDGHAVLPEEEQENAYFSAPGTFLGDKELFYGGTLEFDINPSNRTSIEVRLHGDGWTITETVFVTPNVWNHRTVTMSAEAGWFNGSTQVDEARIRLVLGSLELVAIEGTTFSFFPPLEQTRLDNVVWTSQEVFDWQRLDSGEQLEGEFGTFAEALAAATAGDTLLFVNPGETALDLGTVTIAVDDLTVQGGVLLDGIFKLGSTVNDFTLESTTGITGHNNADVIGNARPNHIVGSGGDNDLNGGAGGGDTLEGGNGDDRYNVDNASDGVREETGEGYDVVFARANYSLAVAGEVEELRAYGTTQGLQLTGNAFAQSIFGSAHNDTLDGAGSDDVLRGFAGDDVYIVQDSEVTVIEAANQGEDTVRSSVDYVLRAHVEHLELTGAAIKGFGNSLANVIDGNGEDNILQGKSGNDVLAGYGGSDRMTGGADADTFVLSGPASNEADSVFDFSAAQGDRLAVFGSEFGLAAGALGDEYFDVLGSAANVAHGRFLWSATQSLLYWDADGSQNTSNDLIARISNVSAISEANFMIF